MAWATIDQLVEHLGLPEDLRMAECLSASLAWCNRTRPDLDPIVVPAADIQRAVIIYAALLYRERSTPSGFSTYDGLDTSAFTDQSAMMNVYRLLGTRKPVAR